MSYDPVVNAGKVTVNGVYTETDTLISLATGHGSRLPDPSVLGAYDLIWWNSTDYGDPVDDPYYEFVRCTANGSDALTVTRGQQGTTATPKNTASKVYKMQRAITKLDWDALVAGIQAASASVSSSVPREYVGLLSLDGSTPVVTRILWNTLIGAPTGSLVRTNTGTFTFTFPSGTFTEGYATLNDVINSGSAEKTDAVSIDVGGVIALGVTVQAGSDVSWGLITTAAGSVADPSAMPYVVRIRKY